MVNHKFVRIVAWAAVVFIVYATLVPLEMRPTIHGVGPNGERFAAYTAGAALLTLAYPRHWLRVLSFAVALAGGLELLQLAAPHRHASLRDAVVKVAGALVGIGIAYLWNRVHQGWGASSAGS